LALRHLRERSHTGRVDLAKLAEAVPGLFASGNPPQQLLLGSDALGLVSGRIERLQQEVESWNAVTVSTDSSSELQRRRQTAPHPCGAVRRSAADGRLKPDSKHRRKKAGKLDRYTGDVVQFAEPHPYLARSACFCSG